MVAGCVAQVEQENYHDHQAQRQAWVVHVVKSSRTFSSDRAEHQVHGLVEVAAEENGSSRRNLIRNFNRVACKAGALPSG